MGGRQPGRLAGLAAGGLIQLRGRRRGRPSGAAPGVRGTQTNMSEHVRAWIDGGWRLNELKTIVVHVG